MRLLRLVAITCSVVALYAFGVEPHVVVLRTVHVPIRSFGPRGVSILHVSDLHMRSPGWRERRVLALARRAEPDVIALTGDLVSRSEDVDAACRWLGELRSIAPVYAVPGNYAYRVGGERYLSKVIEAGAVLLSNCSVAVRVNGVEFWLLGVDDPSTTRSRLEDALAEVTTPGPRILLAHFPTVVEQASFYDIDLVLAGHTHGGQIRLPGLGAVFPFGSALLKKYQKGLYRLGRTVMYVTSGVGTTGVPARFMCPPEVVLVLLRGNGA